MKTIYRYVAPEHEGGVKVRMVERMTFVPPTLSRPAGERKSFVIILDVPGEPTRFEPFTDMEFACGAFQLACDHFGRIPEAGPVAVFWP